MDKILQALSIVLALLAGLELRRSVQFSNFFHVAHIPSLKEFGQSRS